VRLDTVSTGRLENIAHHFHNSAFWFVRDSETIDEHFAFAQGARGLSVTVLRFFNTYGFPGFTSMGTGAWSRLSPRGHKKISTGMMGFTP
jgi:hypothetical protein